MSTPRWDASQPPAAASNPGAAPSAGPAFGPQPGSAAPAPFMRPSFHPVPWSRRALGGLIDFGLVYLILWVGEIGFFIAYLRWMTAAFSTADPGSVPPTPIFAWYGVMLLSLIPWAIFVLYGRWIKGGRTGQSFGRRVAHTRLVSAATGQPIGAAMTLVRDLAHSLDNLVLIGWLWPLWDRDRRSFADMLLGTVVVPEDEAPLGIVR